MKTTILSIFLMAFTLFAKAQTIDIYVSPEGNDNNTGFSSSQPVASLQQALNSWESLKKAGNAPSVVNILMKGGNYNFTQPVIINMNNGGTATTRLMIRSEEARRAVFNGAKQITGWKKYKGNIWMAAVPEAKEGKWMFNQLFVNGRQRTVARFPNQGYYYVAGFPDGGEEVDYHTDSKRFQFKKGDINPDWKNIRDIRVIVYHFWSDAHLQIDKIDPKTNIVTFKHPAEKRFTDDFSNEGARYIVENVFEGLDSPGEWFLDRYKGVVYYIPQPGEKMETAEVMAPVTTGFIRFEGDPQDAVVENVRIEDISFEYSNFILPEDDGNDMQASMSVPACITASGASGITFSNCAFSNLGNFAFDLQKGCSNITINNNTMEHLSAGAIKINGGTEKDHPLERTRNIRISDNEIIHYGEKYPSAVAILLMNAESCYIVHNHIFDGWYTGISVGWQWGYQRSITRDNIIEYNHIHQIGQGLLSDMGGIYTLGVSPGTIIRNNLVHDVESNKYGGWGIYNDEGSTHILIENNIVYNTKYAAYNIHYAKELTV
ncbi:MAG: right-handed parallel beta-helix repeat-containing protein, partial [Candidatus Saccharibacteria bacterium]